MLPYRFETQAEFVIATITLHNFIRRISRIDPDFVDIETRDPQVQPHGNDPIPRELPFNPSIMNETRDAI